MRYIQSKISVYILQEFLYSTFINCLKYIISIRDKIAQLEVILSNI